MKGFTGLWRDEKTAEISAFLGFFPAIQTSLDGQHDRPGGGHSKTSFHNRNVSSPGLIPISNDRIMNLCYDLPPNNGNQSCP